jgi:hypothetical protein
MLRFGVIAACLCACGSPDSNSLTRAGTTGATGGSSTTGGTPGYGGSGGAISYGGLPGAGGIPAGGFVGAGGFVPPPIDAGVTGGSFSSGGAAGTGGVGTGGSTVDPFPPGGLISQACSDCARANCREQETACVAEPACAAIGQCLSTCILLTCAACLPTLSSQAGYEKFTAVSNCTDQRCQPACPLINAGGMNP